MTERAIDPPLPRHYPVAAFLLLLAERPAHGYELVTRLGELAPTLGDLASHYRLLRTMEADGLVSSAWGPSEAGPHRRTYRLTAPGVSLLHTWAGLLRAGHGAVSAYLERHTGLVGEECRAGAA